MYVFCFHSVIVRIGYINIILRLYVTHVIQRSLTNRNARRCSHTTLHYELYDLQSKVIYVLFYILYLTKLISIQYDHEHIVQNCNSVLVVKEKPIKID